MKYFIIVNGETCTLPARTLEMDERIDKIGRASCRERVSSPV